MLQIDRTYIGIETKCPTYCKTYVDGCNGCQCVLNGMVMCTTKYCPESAESKCETCETMIYSECGGCDVTYGDLNHICTLECREKCQCKIDTPIYDPINKKCITFNECPHTLPETAMEIDTNKYCSAYCISYFDGCNNCTCDTFEYLCLARKRNTKEEIASELFGQCIDSK